jgi:glycine/D-amino acid oxidase-like deaminating enzyme
MGLGPLSDRIAVVGTGVIGASWAAYFLAKGFDVAATDPADGAEKRLRTLVDGFWPALERMGLAEGASRSWLRFDPDIMRAVEGCAFIQENGRPACLLWHLLDMAGLTDDVRISGAGSTDRRNTGVKLPIRSTPSPRGNGDMLALARRKHPGGTHL